MTFALNPAYRAFCPRKTSARLKTAIFANRQNATVFRRIATATLRAATETPDLRIVDRTPQYKMKTKPSDKIKSAFKWPGGKQRLAKQILPLFPAHTCYVEPFCGGAAMLFAKERASVEVLNDLNGDIINLFRCAQYHLGALRDELKWIVTSRTQLRDFMAQPGLTDLQRAARWLARNWMSFGASMESYGVQRKSGGGACSSRSAILEKLNLLNQRLDKVSVENLSYERCLELYDSPETLFFLDPPYLTPGSHAYGAFTKEDFEEFKNRVLKLKGQWVLTVDGSDFQKSLWSEFHVREVSHRCGTVNQKLGTKLFSELIITPK